MSGHRAHGRAPQMSASLRRALGELRAEKDESVGQRLVNVGIEPRDVEVLVNALHDYFHDDSHVAKMAWQTAHDAGANGDDPDALPLIDALRELPEGQRQTLGAVLGVACALAAAEGVALGANYVANELAGRGQRHQSRPRR